MNCPVCGTAVTEDFGLVECAKCQAQLIVHIDGRVEVQGEEPTPPLEATPNQVFPPPQPEEFEIEEQPPLMPEDPPPPPLSAEEEVENHFDGSEPAVTEDAPVAYQAPGAAANSPNLSDLAAFANSEDSGGREGPLRYTLLITGIDTADVREAFREALTDRKFMWDIEPILRSIRQGNVKIENVTPGKAYILVSRLRNLPLNIRWEQHAITQP